MAEIELPHDIVYQCLIYDVKCKSVIEKSRESLRHKASFYAAALAFLSLLCLAVGDEVVLRSFPSPSAKLLCEIPLPLLWLFRVNSARSSFIYRGGWLDLIDEITSLSYASNTFPPVDSIYIYDLRLPLGLEVPL
ncbi:hypothetical protein MANES_06G015375v8 [Manihot esculenta]|uniref:Uncharacterized protein n=1 Tax=Manihot esculenta TaxID=3983 RepID=A0ACB7HHU7_MANES|nr:hypothetical protein MANES_06G015375v8 [Manihot esculenta]